jgi:tellurite resistance protein
MSPFAQSLKFLFPAWFSIVMGLTGLSLAWHRAVPFMGEPAYGVAAGLGVLAGVTLAVLVLGMLWRHRAHPKAWGEDAAHPVRHAFMAAAPIGFMLVATVAVALWGPSDAARGLWWLGSLGQFGVTWWVVSRWWAGPQPGGFQWPSFTPAILIPIVGNVLSPLGGVTLGHPFWAAAQFGVGLMFWPVVLVLIWVRVGLHGMYPARLMPANFIFVAPPALLGLGVMQFNGPMPLVHLCWGMALFTLFWVGGLVRRIAALPFGLPHWGMSFPLAAFTALTLRLAEAGVLPVALGVALLALTTAVVAWLLLGTWRGLRDGSLLAPEPVAAVVVADGKGP